MIGAMVLDIIPRHFDTRRVRLHPNSSHLTLTSASTTTCYLIILITPMTFTQTQSNHQSAIMANIHLYAEHLLNIRMLSIQASLSTTSNQETRSTLSADGKTLSLEHEGQTAKVQFPAQLLSGKNRATFVIPPAPTKEITFRLRIDEKPGTTSVLGSEAVDSEVITPWTAITLATDVQVSCKSCNAVVVEQGRVRQWKDLPSEGWAEMMEFWHCHKPDIPHDAHDHADIKKGYAANSQLIHEPGVCLVSPIEFLFAVDDCQNLETGSSASTEGDAVNCSNCKGYLGSYDEPNRSYRLRKPYLGVTISPEQEGPASFMTEKWLSCLLLNAIDNQGVRKFTVRSSMPGSQALKLWIFTPDLNVSSSANDEPDQPIRTSKVMWEDCTDTAVESEKLNSQTISEGEIELPHREVEELRHCLETSAAWLPEGVRTFQSWKVGLLRRFTRKDIGQI
nr:uncharacterized protein CFP56_09869 [Quercus suber]